VVVLGVSNETATVASQGIASFGIRYPVAIDRDDEVFEAYGASSLPTLYVLDRRGVVRAVEVGFSREQLRRVEQLLAELLEEPG
jgi:peroxiredoxin